MELSRDTVNHADTRDRLLDAAESLFGERGFKGTSLRAITDRADANVASVNYHFGSKLELLKAVLLRATGYIRERQLELLELSGEAQGEGARGSDAVRSVARTMVQPFFELSERDRERVQTVSRLMGRLLSMRDEEVRSAVEEKNREIEDRYLEVLSVILPSIPAEELRWRFQSCMAVVIHDQTRPASRAYAESHDYHQGRLVNLIQAALAAPPASN